MRVLKRGMSTGLGGVGVANGSAAIVTLTAVGLLYLLAQLPIVGPILVPVLVVHAVATWLGARSRRSPRGADAAPQALDRL